MRQAGISCKTRALGVYWWPGFWPNMPETQTLDFENPRALQALYANDLRLLKNLEDALKVKVTTREGWVRLEGEPENVARARQVFQQLDAARKNGVEIRRHEFDYALRSVSAAGRGCQWERPRLPARCEDHGFATARAHRPQERRPAKLPAIDRQTRRRLWCGAGGHGQDLPRHGNGGLGLQARAGDAHHPDPAGGRGGRGARFLPGDLNEKIFPYLRPLYDALGDMLDPEEMQRHMDRGVIEVAPLAYMRGRTLNRAFIVLDEAQNTTTEQMFMFLTRLGLESKCVVTGDQTQIDLPNNKRSGLIEAMQALKGVEGVAFQYFEERDVVTASAGAIDCACVQALPWGKRLGRRAPLRQDQCFTFSSESGSSAKGLASAKIRRRRTHSELLYTLETGPRVRVAIFVLFCTGLAMLILTARGCSRSRSWMIALLIFATALAQLWVNHPVTFASNSRITPDVWDDAGAPDHHEDHPRPRAQQDHPGRVCAAGAAVCACAAGLLGAAGQETRASTRRRSSRSGDR